MKLADIFHNQFGRLRSGWRFAVFIVALVLLSVVVGGTAATILINLPIGFSQNSLLGFLAPQIILLTLTVFLGWFCGKFFEDLPFRALGAWLTKNWLKDFAAGLLIGALTLGGAVTILIVGSATRFQFNRDAGQSAIALTLAVSFGIFAFGAAAEEAFFRGYIFQTFSRAKLAFFAVSLTSMLFAAMHTDNPSANYLSFFNTFLAGIWFAAAYLKTRTLWLVFGLHLAWNWMQGAIFGISVSGITSITTAPLMQATNTGSTFINGGDYGIEGGIACTIALILSTFLIWFAPFLKPTAEMLILTSEEKPAAAISNQTS